MLTSLRLTLLFLLLSLSSQAQLSKAEALLAANTKRVQAFEPAGLMPGRKQVLLSTGFNNGTIIDLHHISLLQGKQIESIELVYTDYAESPSFDQNGLNHKRLKHLQFILPSAFAQPYISWKLVAQQPSTREQAQKLFHGFAVIYREAPSEESMQAELMYLKEAVARTNEGTSSTVTRDDITASTDGKWNFTTTIKVERRDTVLLKHVEEAGMERVDTLYDTGLFGRRVFYIYTTDTKGLSSLFTTKPEDVPYGRDSAVSAVLNRNCSSWKNIMIVGDLTGSMSPYSAQLLTWYKKNSSMMPVKRFVFFNDGNRMADADKMPGQTGGIYSGPGDSFSEVMKLAEKTMRSGGGGDIPENNLEALLFAIDDCSDCEAIVMVADNLASPRDMKLLSKITKPVKVIVCGAQMGINPDYLDIARATGGSVHLIDEDITDLSSANEGDSVQVGKQTFTLKRGRFVVEDR